MYSRANPSRTVALVVALSLTAVSTGAAAWAFDAAVTRSTGDLDRSNAASTGSEIPVSFEPWQLAGLAFYDSGADPAAARLIKRIRKVE